jgi:hypothetical protein
VPVDVRSIIPVSVAARDARDTAAAVLATHGRRTADRTIINNAALMWNDRSTRLRFVVLSASTVTISDPGMLDYPEPPRLTLALTRAGCGA